MSKLIGISGLIFAFLSVIALIGPGTPLGNKIRKITFLNNENFNRTHKIYSKLVFFSCIGVSILLTYLILIYFSFFTVQKYIFNILYMGCLLFIIMIIMNIRTTKIFEYEKMFLKFFYPFLSFIIFLSATHYILDRKFNNGDLNIAYTNFKADKRITLVPLDTLNAIQLRDYFADEYKLNAGIILLNELRNANNFKINLENPTETKFPKVNKLQKECSKLFKQPNLDKEFLGRVKEQVDYINDRKIGKLINVFPPQIQPNYVSINLIYQHSKRFSTLAKGSKMYLTIAYLKLLDNLGAIGIWITLMLIPLISIILTKKINSYNNKHVDKSSDEHNLFFMFVSVIGLLIALWSLI